MLARLAVTVAALTIAVAVPAAAETFVVSPTGVNATPPCTVGAPCDLATAMTAADSDDDAVVLQGGTYDLGGTFPQQIFGTLGPVEGGTVVFDGVGILQFSGTLVHDLHFAEDGDTTLGLGRSALAEHLVVGHRGAAGSAAVSLGGGGVTLRDSVVIEHGDGAVAVLAAGPTPTPGLIENVTAIATGAGSTGIGVNAPGGFFCNLATQARIRNSIARGTLADVRTYLLADDPGCAPSVIDVDLATSDFRTAVHDTDTTGTITLGPGNLPGVAVFADAAYRQRGDSPTVDAGVADASTGTRDLDGEARAIDGRPDIGADEMIARPSVSTDDAALPGPTTPELHASAAPGLDTTLTGVRFEYGASAAYGSGVDAVTADARWSALAPGFPVGTLLHYRAVATVTGNGQTRSVAGADRTVLLLSPPPPVPLPVPTPKPLPKLAAATVIKLTAPSRTCSSRRTLTLRFAAPKGTKIVKAKITLRGKSTTYTGKRLKPRIDLRGLPKGTFKVKVSVTLADGRAATLSKTYKTCSVRRRASGR